MAKRYLGDGVYVDIDSHGLVLTSENGIEVLDTIVLSDNEWMNLVNYVEYLERNAAHGTNQDIPV